MNTIGSCCNNYFKIDDAPQKWEFITLYTNTDTQIHVCVYTQRERERERERLTIGTLVEAVYSKGWVVLRNLLGLDICQCLDRVESRILC